VVSSSLRPVSSSVTFSIEDLQSLVEQVWLQSGYPLDRQALKRALQEAALARPGLSQDLWTVWVDEASESLSQQCRRVEGRLDDFLELAECAAPLVIWLPQRGILLGLTGGGEGRIQAHRSGSGGSQRLTRVALKELLQSERGEELLQGVVFEGHAGDVLHAAADDHHASPWDRLRFLMRPERSDIGVILVFAAVNGLLALATPIAVESLVNTVALGQLFQPLIVLTVFVFFFLAFGAGLKALQTMVVETIQKRLFARVAGDLAYRLPRVTARATRDTHLPELVNRFFDVITVQKVASGLLLDGVSLVIGTLVGMMVLGFYHPWLLGIDLVLLVLMVAIIVFLGRGAIETSIKESKRKYAMAAWLEDVAAAPLTFHYEGAADFALDRTDRLTFDYLEARGKHFKILMRQVIAALLLQALGSSVLLGAGGWLVMQGQLTLGQLVAAELIVAVIVGSFVKLGKHIESFYDLLASVDKLGYLFDLPIQRQQGLMNLAGEGPARVDARDLTFVAGDATPVFEGVSLHVAAGDRLAVMGPSGSGKSLLVDLVAGWAEPQRGEVVIDDIDPHDVRPDVLHRRVTVVRQPEVFTGTIAENVHLGRPGVSLHDVRQALTRVGLLNSVQALPEGLDTSLNPGGTPFTELQLRRLTLARAIVGGPRLLIIDGLLDAFSDADAMSLGGEVTARRQPWTLILVTGRESLAAMCDQRLDLGLIPEHRN
jgi:ABC-type bacteriocin/lantibiotic exporter with double-glycine peptidase domain